ncbi:IS3 family transposase, partial [Escherichia coli]|nr:IS3 family transposase [Escherichia coli]
GSLSSQIKHSPGKSGRFSLSHYRFKSRDEAISVIQEYIEIFYNRQRRHSRLGNISPAAFRIKYYQMAA